MGKMIPLLAATAAVLAVLLAHCGTSDAAMCGDTEYFEYKFKPIKASPVNEEDNEHAHGRCGTGEKHCELEVMVYGNKKCKKGKGKGNGVSLRGPDSKNVVAGNEFNPHNVEWTVHSDWDIAHAYENPFVIQLCDHDSFLRGGNDQLISVTHQHIQKGCQTHTQRDDHKDHPWELTYELCCKPIAKQGFFRGQKGG